MAISNRAQFSSNFALDVAGLIGGIAQAEAYRVQGQYEEKIANLNARFAEMEAKDILETGAKDASEHGKRINQIVGTQRANYAAQNVAVDVGTAADIQDQTREIGADEKRQIKNNAWRQAFGLKQEAAFSRQRGQMARNEAGARSTNTLITAGLGFAKDSLGSYTDAFGTGSSSRESGSSGQATYDPGSYAATRRERTS